MNPGEVLAIEPGGELLLCALVVRRELAVGNVGDAIDEVLLVELERDDSIDDGDWFLFVVKPGDRAGMQMLEAFGVRTEPRPTFHRRFFAGRVAPLDLVGMQIQSE